MAEDTDDGFLREIEEELRQENLKKAWDKYGIYVVIVVLAIVLGVAGFKGWQYWDHRTRAKESAAFAAAAQLETNGKTDQALAAFGKIEKDAGGGYAMLARFREATLLAKSGKLTAASASFEALANDDSIPARYRDLARLQAGIYALNAGADGNKVADEMKPLRADGNAYRFSAMEVSALALVNAGKTDEAKKMLKTLTEDAGVPRDIAGRAGELLQTLGD